jgi:osmoprotectant transport system substrate-binding protein
VPTGARPAVKLGAANFSESVTLAELYGQVLEANGFTVNRDKLNNGVGFGPREATEPLLESGDIDLMPEYLASYLAFVNTSANASTDPAQTSQTLQQALTPKGLTILQYAPAVDVNGFAVTQATAQRLNLSKLSDLAPVASQLTLGGPPECPQRPFCALGLQQTYGIPFKVQLGGPSPTPTVPQSDQGMGFTPISSAADRANALQSGQIQVAVLFTTDPNISDFNFKVLEDDKHWQLSDNIAPVVRNALLTEAPEIRTFCNSVSAVLTTDDLVGLNAQVDLQHKDSKDVAAAYLKSKGLVR